MQIFAGLFYAGTSGLNPTICLKFFQLMQNLEPESKHPSRRSLSSKATLIRADRKKLNSGDANDDNEPILTENDIKNNKELEKLKLIGPGPKMIGLGIRPTGLDDGKNDLKFYFD